MNILDCWATNDRLRTLIARRMLENGEVLSHKNKSNVYVGVDEYKVRRFGRIWNVFFVDGMTCEIKTQD